MVEVSLHAPVSQELRDHRNEIRARRRRETKPCRYVWTRKHQSVEEELGSPSCAPGGGVKRRRRILRSVLRLLLVVFVEEERKHSQDAADSHADGFALRIQREGRLDTPQITIYGE